MAVKNHTKRSIRVSENLPSAAGDRTVGEGTRTALGFTLAMWDSRTTRTLLVVLGIHQTWERLPFL